ncbi:MAG TPA: flagellar basal body P-ring formation chaperone FlgA [Phenylobacterium sp.]|uniref:flagellar basal body P-ring formation chaperone FlgA n=1 Tax=Phenylobacterium sp. TaxID=1871053 RepID=UPI002B46189A|nr:flagellar basal body P-ring formation chaperone FlgA [Phenylobacterium sp.]HKR88427.1 flagellar basal body P-ring formation chaperone FlgA [Phenylobacterium sp.]
MKALALLAAVALAAGSPALAGTAVTLKADTASADAVVTLGDLFDGSGAAANVPVASRTGASVVLNARAVQIAAARAGLDWANAEGLRTVVVHGDAAGGTRAAAPSAPRGNIDVLTWARSLQAGEIVQPQDLVWGKAAAAPADAATDADQVIGMAAKRPLRAGAVVAGRDVGRPQVVKPGEMVTVTFSSGGITLSLSGKALNAAAVGETLNVQNTASKKTIQATVTGPGQAVVGPDAEALKAPLSARYALR